MATRIGVDVGGTFTDLIYYDDQTGEVLVGKEPTTPASPEQGVIAAVQATIDGGALARTGYFLHGTTVGLNSLLTRTGAVVGLLCTRGFRDILETRRGDRDDPYDLFWRPAPPLVPRRLRIPVTERVRADGQVHVPFDTEDVRNAVPVFQAEGVTAVAIAFMNAYANPAHELEAERILREAGFTGEISVSHRVSGEYREYERTSTTVIDAFVRGRMASYLDRLEQGLTGAGFDGSLLVTRSGGGAMTFAEAGERPFETIMSGPVAGAEGGAELARTLGLENVVTADVGGTSFDTCLISDGRLPVLYEGTIVGMPLQTAWVDVRSIGAGGGSLAYVDVGGLLRVGPQSAGADPGPASYGRGGTQPTVTDAAAVLGMLAEGSLAGGVSLDIAAARAALEPLAQQLSLSVEEVARGVLTIVTANMANAIREITVEQGQDPRVCTLMPFGGAGPLFGTLLAGELELGQIVVPPVAGNFSAWGLLGADLVRTASRTRIVRLDEAAIEQANAILAEQFGELGARLRDGEEGEREVGLDMRYTGQEHFLTVRAPAEDGRITASAADLRELFTRDYERTFGHTMEGLVEIVAVRATIRTSLPRRARERHATTAASGAARTVDAWSFTRGETLPFQVVERASIATGASVAGPAILLEPTATTYLDAGWAATAHESGSLFVTQEAH
ncbi:MAG: hydantoinase/oxoprolinase family protein [Thermoleophilia bacterium]